MKKPKKLKGLREKTIVKYRSVLLILIKVIGDSIIFVTNETSGVLKDEWVYSMGYNDMFLVKYNSDGVLQ